MNVTTQIIYSFIYSKVEIMNSLKRYMKDSMNGAKGPHSRIVKTYKMSIVGRLHQR